MRRCGTLSEAATALGIIMDETHAHLVTPLAFAQLMHAASSIPVEEALCAALGSGTPGRLGLLEAAEPLPGRPLSHQMIRVATAELPVLLGRIRLATPGAWHGVVFLPAFDDALRALPRNCSSGWSACADWRRGRCASSLMTWPGGSTSNRMSSQPATDPYLIPLLRLRNALPVLDLTGVLQPGRTHAHHASRSYGAPAGSARRGWFSASGYLTHRPAPGLA